MRAMFLVGTAIWAAAGVVVGFAVARDAIAEPLWLAVCAAGICIGVGGWLWSRWRRW